MDKKVLYIDSWDNVGSFFREKRNSVNNVDSYSLYGKLSFKKRVLKKLAIKFEFLNKYTYGEWKNAFDNYDLIIMDSRNNFESALKYIRSKNSNKRIVIWYWNQVTDREMNPYYIREKYKVETWTFDKFDAQEYKMYYNNSYYFYDNTNLINPNNGNKVFYIGIDREGRLEKLEFLKDYFKNNHINYEIRLTKSPIMSPRKNYKYSNSIKYDEVVKRIKESSAIIDLTKENQYGLTLRPLEAMFYKKKLITDNRNIKEFDFYNKHNIFILGVDDINELAYFLKQKYVNIDKQIEEKYDFKEWVNRIINGEEYI